MLLLGGNLMQYLGGYRLGDVVGVRLRCRSWCPLLSFLRTLVQYHVSAELLLLVVAIALSLSRSMDA